MAEGILESKTYIVDVNDAISIQAAKKVDFTDTISFMKDGEKVVNVTGREVMGAMKSTPDIVALYAEELRNLKPGEKATDFQNFLSRQIDSLDAHRASITNPVANIALHSEANHNQIAVPNGIPKTAGGSKLAV